ncbi:hypothetical protein E4T50_02105 [Aureobasidium sp. EXF-12298]|nr:hypothetical protein E4T50_02105 [Aureobasidium sp. EXF-12298]KAI4766556.1 hypothetical protein E4T51_00481 [Aureobasidium sp. EXF-12344]KAI4784179.1 hypothetical protein E4T52_00913 [Aureobasidium sp. EXF-3400]
MADSSTPLTALCSICHSAPPKYTCPRDAVRTCSLACSQSHKRRAACSGIRDPAAYVSKSSLQTAGGIDRDYNFLSGLERNLDRADKETSERGVALDGKGKPVFQKRWHDNGALGKYLREHGIVVHKAPIGMARQKANQTRFIQKSKRIVWSVEWIVDGEKRVAEVDESRTLEEAYKELVLEKERENKKRKRTQEDAGAKTQKQKVQTEKSDIEESKTQSVEGATASSEPALETEEATTNDTPNAPSADETTAEDASQPQQQPPSEKAHSTQEKTHFYLHKPHTSSTSTVLIPLDPTATLTTALHQKHVLEFPTVYAFTSSPSTQKPALEAQATKDASDILPQGFITVQQYNEQRSAEDKELMGLMESIPEGQRKIALDGGIFGGGEDKEETVDEKQILEVLQRDADALKQ